MNGGLHKAAFESRICKRKKKRQGKHTLNMWTEILHFFFNSTIPPHILDANTAQKNNADSVIGCSDTLTKVALFLQAAEPVPSPFSLRENKSKGLNRIVMQGA